MASILSNKPIIHFPTIMIEQNPLCKVLEVPNTYGEIYIALLLFSLPILFFISAPYGKLKTSTWTFDIPARWAWFIMESPGFIVNSIITILMLPQLITNVQFAYDKYTVPVVPSLEYAPDQLPTSMIPPQINLYVISTIVSVLLYNCHYFYRSIIYPALTRSVRSNDLFPVLLAAVFNASNGLIQGYSMFCTVPQDITQLDFSFYVLGHVGFMISWAGCFWCDMYLVSLRSSKAKPITTSSESSISPGSTTTTPQNSPSNDKSHYTIPTRGLFKYTYSANYLCEFMQWISFALMVPFATSRWLFVALTFCNLFPRAYQYRRFYRQLSQEQSEKSKKK